MTREEAIELLEDLDGAIEDNQGRDYDEAFRMAIEALSDHSGEVTEMVKKDLTSDGTLKVNVSDASKVKRVMVWGENSGGLYYLDEGCDKCKYFPFSEESNVQKMHDGDRPKGEWVFHVNFSDESQRDDYDLICTNCGELYRCDCQDDVNDFVWNAHYCMNCGAYMGGDNGKQKHL